jgi:small subunit ribosomal protein S9
VSKELLEGVKALEKERGIEAETLLSAIEEALLAAYKKMPDARHPVRVDLDRESGDYVVWSVTPDAWDAYLEVHPHHRPVEPEEEPEQPLDAAPQGAEGEQPAEEEPRERRPPRREKGDDKPEEEVIPGMHLEPDLVLEEQAREEQPDYGQYAEVEGYGDEEGGEPSDDAAPAEPEPVAHTPLDLAADARYRATGKRKSAVARVILKPGEGTFSINGRHLDEYFPRVKLQRVAQQPLEAAGYNTRMDVVARIHGGGVAAQATALRHGIARALVEADPALRSELKRRGYLTRDPRVKERKKAGLKKARKRPQFSKR